MVFGENQVSKIERLMKVRRVVACFVFLLVQVCKFSCKSASTGESTLMLEHKGGLSRCLVVVLKNLLKINIERQAEVLTKN